MFDTVFWQILIAVVFLSGYVIISKRFQKIPAIPIGLIILYLITRIIASMIHNLEWAAEWTPWIQIASVVILSWAVARLTLFLLVELPLRLRKKKELPNITRDLILITCYAILFFIVLRLKSNINLTGILTTSAVLTVVVGFAAQTTLSSLISGLILQIERPFALGDWIKLGENRGRVIGITWKSTRLLTRQDVLVYIPNAEITNKSFLNYSKPNRRLVSRMNIGIEYDAPPNTVRKVVLEVINQHPQVLETPPPEIYLVNFGDFAITYEIRFYHNNFADERRIKSDINTKLWYALRRNHIKIPFPIRDVHHRHVERRFQVKELAARRGSADIDGLLKRVSVFSALSEELRSQIAERSEIIEYGSGEFIVRQGDQGDSLYIIRTGLCGVYIRKHGKQERRIASIESGGFFGEMSLLTGEPHTATVRAMEDTSVIIIDKENFSNILTDNPSISDQLGEILAERQKELAEEAGRIVAATASSTSMIAKIKSFFRID
ncbi:MAG: mechanosensitive ion channel family protein [Desulfobacterales bacterium]